MGRTRTQVAALGIDRSGWAEGDRLGVLRAAPISGQGEPRGRGGSGLVSKGLLNHHREDFVFHKSEWPRRELGEGLAPPFLSFRAEGSSRERSPGNSKPAEDPAPRGHLRGRGGQEDEKLEVTEGHGGGDSVAPSREMGSSCGAGWRHRITRPWKPDPSSAAGAHTGARLAATREACQ